MKDKIVLIFSMLELLDAGLDRTSFKEEMKVSLQVQSLQ
jgi:hypothetical protein